MYVFVWRDVFYSGLYLAKWTLSQGFVQDLKVAELDLHKDNEWSLSNFTRVCVTLTIASARVIIILSYFHSKIGWAEANKLSRSRTLVNATRSSWKPPFNTSISQGLVVQGASLRVHHKPGLLFICNLSWDFEHVRVEQV